MKLRFIYILAFAIFATYVLQSKRLGLASQLGMDRTGSPIANGLNCGSCHSGGFNGVTLTLRVKNSGGMIVTSYIPGNTYTVEFDLASNFNFTRGFQGVALTSSNAQAGTFSSPQTNTQISTIGNRQYVEHNSPALSAGTFVFIASWTAPAINTGNVTIYADGVVANGNNGTSGDDPAGPVTLVLTEQASASIDYAQTTYCQASSDPTPVITGTSGGVFAAGAGLILNSITGQIDLSASMPGTYTVTYTSVTGVTTDVVTIIATDNASFSYPKSSYCLNENDPTPMITGLAGGSFATNPAGLVINSSTGQIDVSASAIGTYSVGYITNGPCPTVGIFSISITNTDDASFAYGNSTYCQNGSNPTPTPAITGGTYSSSAGLSINANSGLINLSASTAGTYTVTYTTAGACSNSSTQSVIINGADNASFNYNASVFCQNGNDPTPNVTGLNGGIFSSTSGLSINGNTGQIDVSASSTGTYNVSYTTNGLCPSVAVVAVNIQGMDNASFTYGGNAFCQNGTDPSPTVSLPGGTWSSSSGLSINANTGQINLSASTAGTYSVTYTTNGFCPNSNSTNITIAATDNATFSYNANSSCQNGSDLVATIAGFSGGTFTSTSGLSININTGLIDVSTSTAGTYNVTYTTNGSCPNSMTLGVTILTTDNASFTYSGNTFCQNGTDPSPTVSLPGGTWSSSSGLSINANTGQIDLSASTAGTYSVTYTTNGSCPSSNSTNITITATDNAAFSYNANSSCQNGSDLVATITGLSGGTFTSTSGLSINANTGLIDVSASTAGTYNVLYTTNGSCPNSMTLSVTVIATDDASFSYGGATFCQNATDPSPTINLVGGIFGATPTGLILNSSTGQIDVSASNVGTYNLTYTTNGSCQNSSSLTITITATGNASFNYSATDYCQNVANPSPTITGNPGGIFTSTAGLVLNSTTGEVDLMSSTLGNYTVSYAVAGACPSSSSVILNVLEADIAAFGYTDTTICLNIGVNPVLNVTGVSTGIYTVNSSGLVFANATTGEVDLAASVSGNYVITYTSNGNCPAMASLNVDLSVCGGIQSLSAEAVYGLFPNPNEGRFSIENKGAAGNLILKVRDIYGKIIYLQEAYLENKEQFQIEVPGIAGGMYLIEIQKGGTVKVLKMIVSEE
jgi:hypothetical protein